VYEDCNENGYPDTCDITAGFEDDCNEDREPDSCTVQFVDCNDNEVPDDCDIDPTDPDGDGVVIDDCQPDDIPDDCQLFANDCDLNGVPDECDLDTDGDNVPDECELCDNDPNKTDPGICDCGTPDEPPYTDDDDEDGVPNCKDLCPDTPPGTPVDPNGCPAKGACCALNTCFNNQTPTSCSTVSGTFLGPGTFCSDDEDGDNVTDCFDLCPGTAPGVQVGPDGCPAAIGACCIVMGFCADPYSQDDCENAFGGTYLGDGTLCDILPDRDGDDATDDCDECPDDPDKIIDIDSDGDQVVDCVDGCPDDPTKITDVDTDGDSVLDCNDICPGFDDSLDADGDTVPDGCDICPGFDDSLDADGDNTPDGCDGCPNEPALTAPDEPDAEITCDDGIDNDCDGATDAADSDCSLGCPYQCGDINGSGGGADLIDFATFANCYGRTSPDPPDCTDTDFVCSDLDGDGKVRLTDFATFGTWFGVNTTLSAPDCEIP
jgi:hypothetical protein